MKVGSGLMLNVCVQVHAKPCVNSDPEPCCQFYNRHGCMTCSRCGFSTMTFAVVFELITDIYLVHYSTTTQIHHARRLSVALVLCGITGRLGISSGSRLGISSGCKACAGWAYLNSAKPVQAGRFQWQRNLFYSSPREATSAVVHACCRHV